MATQKMLLGHVKGDKGDTGNPGKDAVTPTFTVTAEEGETIEVEQTGTSGQIQLKFKLKKGDKGDTGKQGDAGKDATINGHNVTTIKGEGIADVSTDEAGTITVSVPESKQWDITIQHNEWSYEYNGSSFEESGYVTDTWAGMTTIYHAEKECMGMTADTDITGIQFTSGDRNSAAVWNYLRPGKDKVTLFSNEIPTDEFSLRLTEVK